MINIAILTSDDGDCTEKIIQYFNEFDETTKTAPFQDARISCIVTNNNPNIFKKLRRYKVEKYTTDKYIEIDEILTKHNIHYIVLSNYSDKIPPNFCNKYQYRIVNLHQSLLPKYSDKIGINIHESVKANGENKTGISIHFVNQEPNNITFFQKDVQIYPEETAEEIMHKVQILEHKYYPVIIEKLIRGTYNQLFEKK